MCKQLVNLFSKIFLKRKAEVAISEVQGEVQKEISLYKEPKKHKATHVTIFKSQSDVKFRKKRKRKRRIQKESRRINFNN